MLSFGGDTIMVYSFSAFVYNPYISSWRPVLGLIVSILSTLTSDVSRIASFFLSLLMFITPVIYDSSEKVLWLQQCNLYNPLTYLITAPRDLILTGTMSNPFYYIVSIVMTILLFMVALRFFYISEKKVIEKMI